MLFKFKKIVGCIEPVRNRDTNRIVSWCIVTALMSWGSTKYNSVACISLVYSSASGVMMNHLYLDTQMGVLPQSIESISSKKSSLLWHDYTLFTVMSFYFGPCCWYFVRITEVLRTFFLYTLLDPWRPFYWLGHVSTLGPPRHPTPCREEDSEGMGISAFSLKK